MEYAPEPFIFIIFATISKQSLYWDFSSWNHYTSDRESFFSGYKMRFFNVSQLLFYLYQNNVHQSLAFSPIPKTDEGDKLWCNNYNIENLIPFPEPEGAPKPIIPIKFNHIDWDTAFWDHFLVVKDELLSGFVKRYLLAFKTDDLVSCVMIYRFEKTLKHVVKKLCELHSNYKTVIINTNEYTKMFEIPLEHYREYRVFDMLLYLWSNNYIGLRDFHIINGPEDENGGLAIIGYSFVLEFNIDPNKILELEISSNSQKASVGKNHPTKNYKGIDNAVDSHNELSREEYAPQRFKVEDYCVKYECLVLFPRSIQISEIFKILLKEGFITSSIYRHRISKTGRKLGAHISDINDKFKAKTKSAERAILTRNGTSGHEYHINPLI